MLQLIPVKGEELEVGLSLYSAHERLGAFDAILAATALNRDVEALISVDQAFGDVVALKWVDLRVPALESLLSG